MWAMTMLQVAAAKQLQRKLEEVGKELVPLLGGNLVDKVWGKGKPPASTKPLRIHR